MSPLAQHWLRKQVQGGRDLIDLKKRDSAKVLPSLPSAHCFDLSAVYPEVQRLAEEFGAGAQADSRLAFMPAEVTWIEFVVPGLVQGTRRFGVLLREEDPGEKHTLVWVALCSELHSETAGLIGLGESTGAYFSDSDSKHSLEAISWMIYACLSLINYPRDIGRVQHMPHRGLERDLARVRGLVGKFPLHAWTEIKLDLAPPHDHRDTAHEAHITGNKSFHFCRSHLRVRRGKVEFVRHHWRGDPALGIKQSRYVVVPQKAIEA
jgi:hypothetical protein